MISAKNYAAQAVHALKAFSHRPSLSPRDQKSVQWCARRLKDSVHFVLPDSGLILNDGLKGLDNLKIELPFPEISLEFLISGGHKCVIYASSHDERTQELSKYGKRMQDMGASPEYVLVFSVYTMPAMPAMGRHWCLSPHIHTFNKEVDFGRRGPCSFFVHSWRFLPDFIRESGSSDEALLQSERASFHFLRHVLELCEALSCTNVSIATHQKASTTNERRIKKGKLPIYETKVLVIDTPQNRAQANPPQGGTHASPRQHLRRGHIRRLPTGRNVWVNSCVVGSGSTGRIDKVYAVR